jgi:hypothetical protein
MRVTVAVASPDNAEAGVTRRAFPRQAAFIDSVTVHLFAVPNRIYRAIPPPNRAIGACPGGAVCSWWKHATEIIRFGI